MPKVTWNVSGGDVDNIEPDEEFAPYDGPIPTRGIFRMKVNKVEYVKFKTGSKGLKVMLLIDDPRKDKKQYNGCPLWENIIDLPETDFKIKQWLDAIGATGKDWDGTVIDKENLVTKIGRVNMAGLFVRATVKSGKNQQGEARPEVNRFMRKSDEAETTDDSDAGDDGEDDPAPF